MRTDILTPPGPTPVDFALSPDGTQSVYVAYDDDSVARLMLRRLDSDASTVERDHLSQNLISPVTQLLFGSFELPEM